VYTRSRHEKTIAQQLAAKGVEHFLPLFEALHRWKDRRVRVSLPLFPGYLFVRIRTTERRAVISVPGVVGIVGNSSAPRAIADWEIEALRTCIAQQARLQPCPYLAVGRKGRVTSGPLADTEGILVRRKGSTRLVLSITLINRSVEVEVGAEDVVALAPCYSPAFATRSREASAA
jgi:transcription antitermination factor NusG